MPKIWEKNRDKKEDVPRFLRLFQDNNDTMLCIVDGKGLRVTDGEILTVKGDGTLAVLQGVSAIEARRVGINTYGDTNAILRAN